MLGKVEADTMIIHDSFALPVEGTETRVNASMQAYEYMSKYMSGNNLRFFQQNAFLQPDYVII